MNRVSFVFSVLLALMLTTGALDPPRVEAGPIENAQALNKEGEQLLERSRYNEALAVFNRMLDSCGGHEFCRGIALFYLGRTHVELAQYDQALRRLKEAEGLFQRLNKQTEIGKTLHVTGRAYAEKAEDYTEALQYYGRAENILGRSTSRDDNELFGVYIDRATAYTYLGKHTEALADLDRAQTLSGGRLDQRRKALLAFGRARVHQEHQEFSEAESNFLEALKYYEQVGDKRKMAAVLNSLGWIQDNRAEYARALNSYRQALTNAQASDPGSTAFVHSNMGILYRKMGNYEEALKSQEKALEIRKAHGIKQFYGTSLNNIGVVYLLYGEYGKALESFRESYNISRQVGSKADQAAALMDLAWVYKDQGDLVNAQRCYEQAVEIGEEIKNRTLAASATSYQALLYEYYGDFGEALKYYRKAARTQEAIGDKFYLSETQFAMAGSLTREGALPEAKDNLLDSLKLKQSIGVPYGEVLCQLALYFMERDRYRKNSGQPAEDRRASLEEARRYVQEAERAIKPEEKRDFMLLTYVKGRYLLEQEPAKSIEQFNALKSLAQTGRILKYSFLASSGLGQAYEKLHNWDQAERAFDDAVRYAEEIRDTLEPHQKRTFLHGEEILGVKHALPYEGLARVRMRKGAASKSLEASEFTKARSFADKLSQKIGGETFGVAKGMMDDLEQLETQLRVTNKRLDQCRAKGGEASLVDPLTSKERQIRQQLKDLERRIEEKYPSYHAVRFAKSIPVDQTSLVDAESAVIYDVTDSGVLIYFTRGRQVVDGLFKVISRERLDALVRAFMEPFERVTRLEDLDKFNADAGKKLFDLLIADVLPRIEEGRSLIIVPDDSLAALPFETLIMNKGGSLVPKGKVRVRSGIKFLGDRNPISYWQSVTALTLARRLTKQKDMGQRLLVIANPIMKAGEGKAPTAAAVNNDRRQWIDGIMKGKGTNDPKQGTAKGTGFRLLGMDTQQKFMSLRLEPLKKTAELADDLRKKLGNAADVYSGETATLTEFERKVIPRISQYGKVLFATHGYFGTKLKPEIEEPVLVFSQIPAQADNLLRMSQVMKLDLNAEIVALLACQSGVGEQITGEGTMGMGRAFQYAGAKSVLMSLWNVEETRSVMLVKSFLDHMSKGMGKLDALQAARGEVRSSGYDHPFFWAPFILVGEIR